MAYIVMAYIVMAYIVMAYIAMAYIVMVYIVMAYIVMAYIVMACVFVAWPTIRTAAIACWSNCTAAAARRGAHRRKCKTPAASACLRCAQTHATVIGSKGVCARQATPWSFSICATHACGYGRARFVIGSIGAVMTSCGGAPVAMHAAACIARPRLRLADVLDAEVCTAPGGHA